MISKGCRDKKIECDVSGLDAYIHETEDHVEIVIMNYHYKLFVGHERMSATAVLRVRGQLHRVAIGCAVRGATALAVQTSRRCT
eukprot:6512133-Heterocapsa_arctica.AAC.1